jgi:hypothetical protein
MQAGKHACTLAELKDYVPHAAHAHGLFFRLETTPMALLSVLRM